MVTFTQADSVAMSQTPLISANVRVFCRTTAPCLMQVSVDRLPPPAQSRRADHIDRHGSRLNIGSGGENEVSEPVLLNP